MHAWPRPEPRPGRPGGLPRLLLPVLLPALLPMLLTLLAALASAPAAAHKSSDAYLFFDQQPGATTLRWDIALRDLDLVLDLDTDGNRALTWGEVRQAWPRIDALALASLAVQGCAFAVTGHALEQRNDGAYAVLQLRAPCEMAAGAALRYSLLADVDSAHRGIVRHTVAGASSTLRVLVPSAMAPGLRDSVAAMSPLMSASASASTSAAASTPALIVENASRADERRVITTLANLAEAARSLSGPALLMVGEAMALATSQARPLNTAEGLPLLLRTGGQL